MTVLVSAPHASDSDGLRFGAVWKENDFDGETAHNSMRDVFASAVAAHPAELREFFCCFGGKPARFRVLGGSLAEHISAPFSHLRINRAASAPQLQVDIWDESLTGCPATPRIEAGWSELTASSTDKRFIGQRLPHTYSCIDRERRRIVACIAWHKDIFIYERAKPLARPLLIWHNDAGAPIIHTALVARGEAGLLFVGKSGSGKSTSALASVLAGFDFLSEDYVALQTRADGPSIGHSVYNSAFVNSVHLERFPDLARRAIRGRMPHEEKSAVVLSQIVPQRLRRTAPIRAVIIPRVSECEDTTIRSASRGQALLALGPSSLLQIPNRPLGASGFHRIADLVQRVPCFEMQAGRDLASIPSRLEELVSTL